MSVVMSQDIGSNVYAFLHGKIAGPIMITSVVQSPVTARNVREALHVRNVVRSQEEKFVLKDLHVRNVRQVLPVRFARKDLHVRNVLQAHQDKSVQVIQHARNVQRVLLMKSVPMFQAGKFV